MDIGLVHAWVALALAGLAVLGAGCDTGAAIPIDDLPAQVEAAYCQRAVTCAGGPAPAVCESSLSLERDQNLGMLVAAVKRGTALYDPTRAKECLDAFAVNCVEDLDAPPACGETFRGSVAAGGTCQVAEECVSGSCQRSCGDACCAGTCGVGAGKVFVGGACGSNGGSCVEGAFCKNGKCAPELAVGAPCTAGDLCRGPAQCAIASGSTSGTCVAPPGEGAPCSTTQLCSRVDDYCDPVAQVCVKRKAAGAACNDAGDECLSLVPCRNGVCTPEPTLGQPCDPTTSRCFGDLLCVQGTCAAPPAPANACPP